MGESIYRDNLVEISNDSITFFNYYYPSSKNLTVKFNEIEKFEVKEPTLLTGKYRFWGTGNFITWYPKDFKRNTRDHIFFLFRRNKKIRIGFTVENSQQVISILKSKKMIFI